MGQLDNANSRFNAIVAAVSASAVFHASLVTAAAILIAVEHKWPTVKQDIAGALLLAASIGKVLAPVMAFVKPAEAVAPKP